MKKVGLLLAILWIGSVLFGQNIDSLVHVANSADEEKSHEAMKHLSVHFLRIDTVQAKFWCMESLRKAKRSGNEKWLIAAHENLGRYYTEQARYDSAEWFLQQSILLYDKPENNMGIAATYVSLGNIYDIQSNYEKALECYMQAESNYEAESFTYGCGLAQMGIGNIYNSTGFYPEAKTYFRKSYINLLPKNELYASWSMNNLASAMTNLGEYDSAIYYFQKSLAIKLRHDDVYGASYTYNDMGSLYYKQGKYDLALEHYLKALESKEGLEGISKETLSNTYLDIARIYAQKKNFLSATFYGELGLQCALQSATLAYQSEAYRVLADANYALAKYKDAFDMLQDYVEVEDSLAKLLYNDKLTEMRSKYDAEQKEKEIALLNASNKVSLLETEKANKKTETITLILIGVTLILVLAAVLGISLFRSNKAKHKANELLQKQNEEINHQKELVEEKNKEILDSINYAKRIQNAILPTNKRFKSCLPESFVLYLPKDIVAGDFYWLETRENKVLFAAADCTGHGVPGAMVSVICNNGLNRSVREHGITEPSLILDKTREIVIREFEKSDDEVKDGMDISLVSLEPLSDSEYEVKWAGANNPLWYQLAGEKQLVEIKPDKQPIGKYADSKPFQTHTLKLKKGDRLYIFTDGYQDQFGGEKAKKFKAAKLKEILEDQQQCSMEQVKTKLESSFHAWKGKLEQVDDVCILGIQL